MIDIFSDLAWRGLIHQSTDPEGLPGWLRDGSRTLYAGFDPTADSLHVGHLVSLLMLRRFQRAGHRPIAIVGGATGMIGDPTGKSEERNLLSLETLRANVESIKAQMRRVLDFEGVANPALLVNNYDWISPFSYLEFLRDIGKCFPVNVMLAKDSVKARLERTDAGLSYTEFSYMLLQAYDFVHLNRTYGCELQVGGSDQWGNITAGIDLGRRMHGLQLFGLTTPLLTKSDGTKMGKTEGGAVWLAAERTSPYQFYQYWINVDDADASKCLRFFTDLSEGEVKELDAARESNPGGRDSQRRLAEEVTRLIHGEEGLAAAQRATAMFFGETISGLSDAQLVSVFADVPSAELPRGALTGEGLNVLDALAIESLGLFKSKGEARRSVTQGGAYVNNVRVENVDLRLTPEHLASESCLVLRTGKKKYAVLRFLDSGT